jgi:hypothetical protein
MSKRRNPLPFKQGNIAMGYSTEFVGSLTITGTMSAAQVAYIRLFNQTRRMKRNALKAQKLEDPVREAVGLPVGEEGGYFTGSKGAMGQAHDESVVDFNRPPVGQPGLWCQWTVNELGTELMWDYGEKFYDYVPWLKYLITHFFAPWGLVLNGNITWQGEEQSDNGTIEVRDNKVTTF